MKIKRLPKRKVRWVENKPHGVIQDSTCIVSNVMLYVTARLRHDVAFVAFCLLQATQLS